MKNSNLEFQGRDEKDHFGRGLFEIKGKELTLNPEGIKEIFPWFESLSRSFGFNGDTYEPDRIFTEKGEDIIFYLKDPFKIEGKYIRALYLLHHRYPSYELIMKKIDDHHLLGALERSFPAYSIDDLADLILLHKNLELKESKLFIKDKMIRLDLMDEAKEAYREASKVVERSENDFGISLSELTTLAWDARVNNNVAIRKISQEIHQEYIAKMFQTYL